MRRHECLGVAADRTSVFIVVSIFLISGRVCGGTYRLSPHLLRHEQWKVCEHGTVTRPVTAESMRSRHTGHVGSSYAAP